MNRVFSRKLAALAIGFATALSAGHATGAHAAGEHEGKSVVSLDFCADQYALAFADRDDILAVSQDATGPLSFYRGRAEGLAQTRSSAEEVLMLRPDIVIRTYRGSPGLDDLLTRLGVEVLQPPYAFDFTTHLSNLVSVSRSLGAPDEGVTVSGDIRARYEALQAAPPLDASAVYLTPSGTTAGKGSAVAGIIALAGLRSFATDIGIRGWAKLPLEEVVMGAPDLVVGSFFEQGAVSRSSWSLSRHGVFRRLIDDLPAVMVPSRFMSCSVAQAVDAAEFIRARALAYGFRSAKQQTQGETAR